MEDRDGRPVILLAEDEPLVRNLIQLALSAAGFCVLAGCDGVEALEISRGFEGEIALLLSDVDMPRMMGPDLVKGIAAERPRTRVLLMTGKSSGDIPHYLRRDMLEKPFLPSKLVDAIRAKLAG
jgi:two-component system, cell cycle sensor histidine kinase and response regulator CckA